MNGISPLPNNLPALISREGAGLTPVVHADLLDSTKIGVKRPSQDESLEAPELKKTNLDQATCEAPVSMTIDVKSETEEAFEMSSEVHDPRVSYYCKLS